MHIAGPNGNFEHAVEFRNSFGGAMYVWMEMVDKYLPGYSPYDDQYKKVWALPKSGRMKRHEVIVMLSTFDNVVVKAENFIAVAEAMEQFYEEQGAAQSNKVCHLHLQAEALRKLDSEREEKGWRAVGWNQTSVNGDSPWYGFQENLDDEDDWTPYNLDKRDLHWFLMEDETVTPKEAT